MANRKRPVLLDEDVVKFKDELVELFPIGRKGVAINLLDEVADLLQGEIERALRHAAGSALHGARIGGRAASSEGRDTGTWIAVGGEGGDGRNCEDCLDLHGTKMTHDQYLDTKYTTACDGNCRCEWVSDDAVDDPAAIEGIANGELEEEYEGLE